MVLCQVNSGVAESGVAMNKIREINGHRILTVPFSNQKRIAWLHKRLGIISDFSGKFSGRYSGYKMTIGNHQLLTFVFTTN